MCWRIVSTAIVIAVASLAGAQAEPGRFSPPTVAEPAGDIILIDGCHRSERDHYVPEVGRSLPHVHLGEDCEPYRITDSEDDSEDEDEDDDNGDYDPDYDGGGVETCIYIQGLEVCN